LVFLSSESREKIGVNGEASITLTPELLKSGPKEGELTITATFSDGKFQSTARAIRHMYPAEQRSEVCRLSITKLIKKLEKVGISNSEIIHFNSILKDTDLNQLHQPFHDLPYQFIDLVDRFENFNDEQKKITRLIFDLQNAITSFKELSCLIKDLKEEKTYSQVEKRCQDTSKLLQDIEEADNLRLLILQNKKKPLDYYDDGKLALVRKTWDEAKIFFDIYHRFALISLKGLLPDFKVKPPTETTHLDYLEYLQRKRLENRALTDEEWEEWMLGRHLHTYTPLTYNLYTELKNEWRLKYPKKS